MMPADISVRTDFLAGPGEMGERIRGFDWTRTPLGPIEFWPTSLKTSISLILGSRHPMWIGWGPETTFLYNDAYLRVLGPAKHPWALGMPASKVWAEIWDVCGPFADKVFERGEAAFVDDVRLFMNRGDFIEETFYSFSYSPIRDDAGRVCGLFCPSTDVTPKVVNARRLATLSELGANSLFDKTSAGACATVAGTLAKNPDDFPFTLLYLADSEGRRASLEQSTGFETDVPAASTIALDADSDSSPWPIAEVYRTGRRKGVATQGVRGIPRGVADQPVKEAMVLPVTSRGEHKPCGVLVTGVNPCRPLDADHVTFLELVAGQVATAIQNAKAIEDEKKRADMLAEIDRAKTVFFSNVSHEFRTPLTLMLGPIESLLAKADGLQVDDRDGLAIAHRNSLRLLKLVNSLLDFSRLEAGRLTASYEPVDLAALTADLASNFQSAMQAAGLDFYVDCDRLPATVYVDPDMWEKIVLNLLSNAFKFTFEGRVGVRLHAGDGGAVLTVSDTGIGISEEELPRIFERFHRIEGARGRTHEGAGIGLALIQEYVKLHGGTISVASRWGAGTTFTITLPFGRSHLHAAHIHESRGSRSAEDRRSEVFVEQAVRWLPQKDEAAAAGRTSTRAGRRAKPRVLLADDNADMRAHVSRILSSDYDVITARDGQEALDIIRRDPPDLLLSDIVMPRLDGLGLLKAVRADAQTRTLPTIFLSARAGEEMRVEGLGAGADDYLVKPFTAAELRARVRAHVDMAIARRRATEREAMLRVEAEIARDQVISVLEGMTDGFIRLDNEWRVTYVNREAETLIGMRREDMLGRSHWDLFPAAAGTTIHTELLRAARERVPVEFENYFAPWQRWFHLKVFPDAGGGLSVFYDDITIRKAVEEERADLFRREREAREEAEILKELSRALAGELDVEKLVQGVTDEATRVTGAEFGVFLPNPIHASGEASLRHTLSGEGFETPGLPRNMPVFETVFRGTGTVCVDDILADPRYAIAGLPARSYLGVPLICRTGEVLGGLLLCHSRAGMFTDRMERLATGTAASAAAAIDNARLFARAEREIEQRKCTERLLRDSELRFREMINALPAAIYTTDAEGRLTHFNPAAVRLSGRTPELGNDRWCVTWKLYHSDGTPLPHDQCPMAAALKGGEIAPGAECIAERPDGSRIWFTPYPTPIRDAHGRITGGINMLVDITERKTAEEALRRSEERFRGVFESSAIGVAILTLETRFLQTNQAFSTITGYSAGELSRMDHAGFTHPDDRPAMENRVQQLISGEISNFVLEARCSTKDGRTIWVNSSVSAVRDALGRPERLIALCEDITIRRKSEADLRESEERFRAIFETTPECVKLVAADGTLVHMNSSGLGMVGAESGDAVIGQSVYRLIAPGFRDAFREFNERICRGERGSLEFDLVGLDNRRRHMETHAAPLQRTDGSLVQLGISRDVTERTRAERATMLLSAIVDSSEDAIISKDLNGVITSWNKSAETLFGYTAEEAVGKPVTILIPPQRLQEEPEILERIRRGERVDHYETVRMRKDGAMLDIALTISPVRNAQGRIIGASKIARDISERQRAEAALRSSEARFRQLADAMPQMVWTARPDGFADYYNERWYEFTGFSRNRLGDKSWEPILHPDDVKPYSETWYGCVASGEPLHFEHRFWDRMESRWRWFMSLALPVRGDDGQITKWFGTCTDIDEQKRVEGELRRANQDLEQFAYSASHDLQEPLRSIKIYGELLNARYGSKLDGQAFEFLGYLRTGATRMEMLVRDLLAYTQVTRLDGPTEMVNADAILDATLETLNGTIKESGVTITRDPLLPVNIHSTHLRQLFQNLIGNAVKYRSPARPPVVHVSAEQQNGFRIFSVHDNGIGIEPEYKEHIFGLFKRLHTGDEYSGTGIGLSICQRIVERYHGRLWVESEPGHGSTFFFAIPG